MFHGKHPRCNITPVEQLSELDTGIIVGLLVGEGHFGGDARQPQVTLRMHVRHERLLRWVAERLPGGRLYGPYCHGGRNYFQWMARGQYLRDVVLPMLAPHVERIDDHVSTRILAMSERYNIPLT